MSNVEIEESAVKRLIKDIKEVIQCKNKNGIYYKHDEQNMLLGYALIIGPESTPYAYGNFLFKLEYPKDYPYSPPKVLFLTNDGKTRFHPNLYKNEKVCLSVLNTWKGEGWTSCQTILSILLILQSILDNKPLTHEPGMTETHKDFNTYNNIIKYKTIQVAVGTILEKMIYPEITDLFWNEILENFKLNYDKILLNMTEEENTVLKTNIYNMNIIVNYSKTKSILTKNIN